MSTTIDLQEAIANQLQSEAARQQTSIDTLVNDLLETYLWELKREHIQAEAKRFREQHTKLLARYAGRYIAMQDGKVLDDDEDFHALHQRIRARYGEQPILIAPVTPDPVQTINILGTRQRQANENTV
jgi:hypothetical protein